MENNRYNLAVLIMSGALMGLLVWGILFLTGAYPDEMVLDRPALIAQLAGSVLLGAINMGGTIVYGIERLGLTRSTLIHYILSMTTIFIASMVLGWFPLDKMLWVWLIFSAVYFVIWLVNLIYWKTSVKNMNRDLEQMRNSRDKGDRK